MNGPPVRSWDCGCSSDNAVLLPCPEHAGPVGAATGLRASDPRLNVVFAPTVATLGFVTSQGRPGRVSALLSRESLLKVMALMGELDRTAEPDNGGPDA